MAITFPKSIFVCNTIAHEKFVFQKSTILCIDILSPVLQILFVVLFKSPISISIALLAATLTDIGINMLYNFLVLKIQFSFKKFNWSLMREVVEFTFFIFLNQILDLLSSSNIDNYLIGRIRGIDDVTVYSMGGKISHMFHSVASPVSAIFVPLIYRIAESKNDRDQLTKVFTKVGKLQFIILYFFLMGFFLWGKGFMVLWVGEGYEESYYVALILMGSLIVALSQNIGIEIQRAVNKHRARSVVYLVIDIANVVISIPLIMRYGPAGAAIGTAMAMFLGTVIFMNIYYYAVIGVNVKTYWINLFKTILYTSPSIIIVITLKVYMRKSGLICNAIQIIIFSIIYLISIYFFILDKNERRMVDIKR
jgi:O-antigen/teichoic acid export membrane protein